MFELADDTTDVYDLRVPYFSFVSILAIAANAFGFNVWDCVDEIEYDGKDEDDEE